MEKVEIINELSEFFKVFSDTTRLRILEVLLNEETSVGVIANKINASNSAVSHQLSYLRSTNLVKTRKEGQVIYYSIADNHIKVIIEYGLEHIKEGRKEINIVLKADVKGSEEAVKNSLEKINVEGVKISVIRSGVGAITESDVILASASNAIIIGFNVVPIGNTKEVADSHKVDIRLYNIIYKVIEEIEAAMKGMLDPEFEENVLGRAEVRQLFKFSKVGTIAGSHVISGLVKSNSNARIIRDGVVIFTSKIKSIQREKNEVKEVKNGFDCGITVENFNDLKERDVIESYEMKEVGK